ncbi:hypothetical protein ACWD4N_41850, partial [Streptomyces sp. NPDC002586]
VSRWDESPDLAGHGVGFLLRGLIAPVLAALAAGVSGAGGQESGATERGYQDGNFANLVHVNSDGSGVDVICDRSTPCSYRRLCEMPLKWTVARRFLDLLARNALKGYR